VAIICRNCGHANCHYPYSQKTRCSNWYYGWHCKEYVPIDNLEYLEWCHLHKSKGLSTHLNIDIFSQMKKWALTR